MDFVMSCGNVFVRVVGVVDIVILVSLLLVFM